MNHKEKSLKARIEFLELQHEALVEALEFYADAQNWQGWDTDTSCEVLDDLGEKARTVLVDDTEAMLRLSSK